MRRRKHKDSEIVIRPEASILHQRYNSEIEDLLATYDKSRHRTPTNNGSQPQSLDYGNDEDIRMGGNTPLDIPRQISPDYDASLAGGNCDGTERQDSQESSYSRRLHPDEATYRLYHNWLALTPTLVHDYLEYMEKSQGRLGHSPGIEALRCSGDCIAIKGHDVQCLYYDCRLLPGSLLTPIY